jgi:uncharacterized RDD family membrane protein YckC
MTEDAESEHRVATRAEDAAWRVHGEPVVDLSPRYVGLVTRAIAGVTDLAIITAVAAIVSAATALVISVFPVSHELHTVLVAVGGVLFFVWVAAYFATFWATTGQTPGNRVMQIRVTHMRGGPIRPRWALVRVVGLAVATFPLFAGFLPILFNERRRSVADWMAHTVVVEAEPLVVQGQNGNRPELLGAPPKAPH